MKRIAVCQFKGRVSPRFNHSAELLMVTLNHSREVEERRVISTATLNPLELTDLLALHQIEILICGGIRKDCQQMLKKKSIQLIDNVIGNVDDALLYCIEGRLKPGDVIN